MAVEYFLMPMRGDGSDDDPFRPKYGSTQDDPSVNRSTMIPYHPDSCLARIDAPQATLDVIAANSDVTRIASSTTMDEQITAGQKATIEAVLESLTIPSQFIQIGETRRELIRELVGVIQVSQRLRGRFGQGLKSKAQQHGVTLDSVWNSFPQALKDELTDVADSFGFTPQDLGLTGTSTLREILVAISEWFGGKPIRIGPDAL